MRVTKQFFTALIVSLFIGYQSVIAETESGSSNSMNSMGMHNMMMNPYMMNPYMMNGMMGGMNPMAGMNPMPPTRSPKMRISGKVNRGVLPTESKPIMAIKTPSVADKRPRNHNRPLTKTQTQSPKIINQQYS